MPKGFSTKIQSELAYSWRVAPKGDRHIETKNEPMRLHWLVLLDSLSQLFPNPLPVGIILVHPPPEFLPVPRLVQMA